LQQITEAFALWLDQFYHTRPGKGRILSGKTPDQVWAARPELRPALSNQELFFAFLKPYSKLPTVSRGATIRVLGREYQNPELFRYYGKQVMVKIDRANLDHAYAFQFYGRLICECRDVMLRAIPANVQTAEDRAALSEKMADDRRPLRVARTIAREMTGGKIMVISPVDRDLIAPASPSEVLSFPTPDATDHQEVKSLPSSPSDPALDAAIDDAIFSRKSGDHDRQAVEPPSPSSDAFMKALLEVEESERQEAEKRRSR
jgi:hypothetical protein